MPIGPVTYVHSTVCAICAICSACTVCVICGVRTRILLATTIQSITYRLTLVHPTAVLKDDKIPQNAPQEERVQKMDEDLSMETSPLDKLFRKTKSTPHIYWLPLTEERIKERNHRKAELERRRVEREKERERSKFSPRTRNRSPRRWR